MLHLGIFGIFLTAGFPVPTPLPAADILILFLGIHAEPPWLLALAGVTGSLFGGYILWNIGHRGGEALLRRYSTHRPQIRGRLARWIRSHGFGSIFIGAILPPPFPFLPLIILTGALGVTRRQLFSAMFTGRSLRYGLEAALAALYGNRILALWNAYLSGWSDVFLWAFLAMLAAGLLYGIWALRREYRRAQQATPHP